ncbi:MAG: CAP domain-containing protein [Crocinitomicaceae bacterium]|nr:MAG: CAP domain-containing protein [Crocinitomicaceae bacterium]
MKILLYFAVLLISVKAYTQQTITVSGRFTKATASCGCFAFGLLTYTDEKGKKTNTYLCFDSEPGDFYEIQNGEELTVTGISKGIRCTNGTLYKNIYVVSSKLEPLNRRLLVPEFIKQQNAVFGKLAIELAPEETKFDLNAKQIGRGKINSKTNQQENNSILTDEEYKLYTLVMEYRKQFGLPSIPISRSLSTVAHLHVQDLSNYFVEGTNCNMHSWSSNGNWTECCYTSDHAFASCMWNKPRELTSYTGNGFEISHGGRGGYVATAESAFNSWKGSFNHNQVMINAGIWGDQQWKSIGIGIHKGYAVIWFGNEVDNQ